MNMFSQTTIACIFCVTACPNITMEALNGSVCPNNSEVVLEKPSTVTFNCIYEIPPPRMTNYTWLLDGEVLFSEFNMTVAHIPIPPGTHYVTCKANIDITGAFGERSNNTEDCACAAAWTIPVTVVGTYPINLSSFRQCFSNNLIILWVSILNCIFFNFKYSCKWKQAQLIHETGVYTVKWQNVSFTSDPTVFKKF